jgi:predicted nucleic acid-binding protein
LLNADDWLHDEACSHFEAIGRNSGTVLTTDLVLAELGNTLARSPARLKVVGFVREIMSSSDAQVVFVTAALLERALARYAAFADKTWGLVDCVSFEVMTQHGCQWAFTHDRHFEQAGFRRLMTGE